MKSQPVLFMDGSMDDAYKELRNWITRQICGAFMIPKHIIDDMAKQEEDLFHQKYRQSHPLLIEECRRKE